MKRGETHAKARACEKDVAQEPSGVKSNYIISRPRPKTPKHTFSPLDKGSGEGHEKDSEKKTIHIQRRGAITKKGIVGKLSTSII